MREEERLRMIVEEPDAIRCSKCSGAMIYTKKEIYQCELCGATYLSNFGRLRQYLEEHGACDMVKLSEATGIDRKTISRYIREGRLQMAGTGSSISTK